MKNEADNYNLEFILVVSCYGLMLMGLHALILLAPSSFRHMVD